MNNLDLVRNEVPLGYKRSSINEVPGIHIDSLSDDVKDLIGMCNPVRADFLANGEGLLNDFLVKQHNILIVNTPDEAPFVRFFYVDTQGYKYARYCGEIHDVDNVLETYFNDFVDESIKGESEEPEQSPEVDTKYIAEIINRFCCDEYLELEMKVNGDYLDFYPQNTHNLLDLLLKGEDIRVKPKKETREITMTDYVDYKVNGKKLVMDFVDNQPQYDTVRFEDVSDE
jgi:hypothetical protein